MKVVAIIPVKPPGTGKSRLEPVLDPVARAALSRQMFAHVLGIVCDAALPALVVSRDAALRDAAAARGCAVLAEDGTGGLNEALSQAHDSPLVRAADGLLILPADLPHLAAADIAALLAAAARTPAVVIAPNATESGTNALLMAPAGIVPFAFGPDSFHRHCAAARAAGVEPVVLRRPGLAFDIDTADDLLRWRAPSRD